MYIKKTLLPLLVLLISTTAAFSQSQGITFEKESTWAKVVRKAKKEKKLIFVDCYTTWCGPCKMLDRDVFSLTEVGDYFNANFVNAKFDCEQPEGIALKERFNVTAYPTMFFYDPVIDQLVHRCIGFMKADKLIEQATIALDTENNLVGLTKHYEAGTLTHEQFVRYLQLLKAGGEQDKQREVALSYLDNLSAEELAKQENWVIMVQNVRDIASIPLKKVAQNPAFFYSKLGKQPVDVALSNALNESCGKYITWAPRRGDFDQAGATQLIEYLRTLTVEGIPAMLCKLYAVEALAKGDYTQMMSDLRHYLRYQFDGAQRQGDEVVEQLRKLATSENKEVIGEAIKWIDEICATTEQPFKKAGRLEAKALLQRAINDEVGAATTALEIKKLDEQGKKESGGAVRAVRMQ